MAWVDVTSRCDGVGPGSRTFHTLTLVEDVKKCFVIGGTNGRRLLSDVQILNYEGGKYEWEQAQVQLTGSRNALTPRARHSAVHIDGKIYVFGGIGGGQGVFAFDIQKLRWIRLRTIGQAPCPRFAHSAVAVQEFMYIVGGHSGISFLSDVFRFCTLTRQWVKIFVLSRTRLPPSLYYTACSIGNEIALVGNKVGSQLDHIWILRCPKTKLQGIRQRSHTWEKLSVTGDPEVTVRSAQGEWRQSMPVSSLSNHCFSSLIPIGQLALGSATQRMYFIGGPLGELTLELAMKNQAVNPANSVLWYIDFPISSAGFFSLDRSREDLLVWKCTNVVGDIPPPTFGNALCALDCKQDSCLFLQVGGTISAFESLIDTPSQAADNGTNLEASQDQAGRERAYSGGIRRVSALPIGTLEDYAADLEHLEAASSSDEEDGFFFDENDDEFAEEVGERDILRMDQLDVSVDSDLVYGGADENFLSPNRLQATDLLDDDWSLQKFSRKTSGMPFNKQHSFHENEHDSLLRNTFSFDNIQKYFSCGVYILDTKAFIEWKPVAVGAKPPMPRCGVTIVKLPAEQPGSPHQYLLLGGDVDGSLVWDPQMLEVSSGGAQAFKRQWQWVYPPIDTPPSTQSQSNRLPPAMTGHSACYLASPQSTVVVFGGWAASGFQDTVWALYLDPIDVWKWVSLKPNRPEAVVQKESPPPVSPRNNSARMHRFASVRVRWPVARACHAVATTRDCFYVVGGVSKDGKLLSDVWKCVLVPQSRSTTEKGRSMPPKAASWSHLKALRRAGSMAEGSLYKFPPRFGHSCVVLEQLNCLIAFGGCLTTPKTTLPELLKGNTNLELSNSLYKFSLSEGKHSWKLLDLECSGSFPTPRYGHGCTLVGAKTGADILSASSFSRISLCVFGGFGFPSDGYKQEPLNDVYIFNLGLLTWSKPQIHSMPQSLPLRQQQSSMSSSSSALTPAATAASKSSAPSPRTRMGMCLGMEETEVLVFGGCVSRSSDDAATLFALDLTSQSSRIPENK